MSIVLSDLPFAKDALEPHISAKTLSFHYEKHHNAYVANTNKLIAGTDLENTSLEEIMQKAAADSSLGGLFNNAAQVWNHSFYWNCLEGNGGGRPHGEIAKRIDADFGSYEKFIEAFKTAGATQFGSGWAWLVLNGDKLEISKTANADTPLVHGQKPLLTVDVWEHAYYLDYQNRRPDYLGIFTDKLINWDFVNSQL